MANHKRDRQLAGSIGPTAPDDPARSILAALSIRPERIGVSGFCQRCTRGADDGATFRPMPDDEPGACNYYDVCEFCELREARTQFVGPILSGIRQKRMRRFSDAWHALGHARDGSAWRHGLRKLRVVEDVALYLGEDTAGLDVLNNARRYLAGAPTIEPTEFGRVLVVRSLDGAEPIHREKAPADVQDGPTTHVTDWPESVARAVWEWNAAKGWQWWHHVAVGKLGGILTLDEIAVARRELIPPGRECYQIFPSEDRFDDLHPAVCHLWHCVDVQAIDADTGRMLPVFDAEVTGQRAKLTPI